MLEKCFNKERQKKEGWKVLKQELIENFNNTIEDFILADKRHEQFDRGMNIYDYTSAKNQIKEMQTLTFGAKVNVLLVTDRLPGCAKGLQEYLQNSTDITVDMAYTLESARDVIQKKAIDFLIIVGYLKHRTNYEIKEFFEKTNKQSTAIMYAILDDLIYEECKTHNITHKYQRMEPMNGFLSFMRICYFRGKKRFSFRWKYIFTGVN